LKHKVSRMGIEVKNDREFKYYNQIYCIEKSVYNAQSKKDNVWSKEKLVYDNCYKMCALWVAMRTSRPALSPPHISADSWGGSPLSF